MKRVSLILAISSMLLAGPARASDWPTYRRDNARNGASPDKLTRPLTAEWIFTPTHPPRHAWADPQPKPVEGKRELPRMRFDDAFHVAAAGGMVYFGSSGDGKVYALDAADGRLRWEFYTDGPVRLAPTFAAGRLYVGSDDGYAYCLDARTGKQIWRFAAAPDPAKIIGNGRMISVWPVRTGVLVDGGVAYFGAGVWPAEGLYLHAVDAATGKRLWTNDSYGKGGASGVSPQGYLVASKSKLFVPSGRTMPAAFSRSNGRFLFHRNFSWRKIGLFGGTYAVLVGDLLFVGAEQLTAVREHTGRMAFTEGNAAGENVVGHHRLAADDEKLVLLTGRDATCFDRKKFVAGRAELTRLIIKFMGMQSQRDKLRWTVRNDRGVAGRLAALEKSVSLLEAEVDGRMAPLIRWKVACPHSDSVAIADGMVLAGGDGTVVGLDPATGEEVWNDKVDGAARGLAVADSRLIVSTDTGKIYCFVRGLGHARPVAVKRVAEPFGKGRMRHAENTAEAIVKASGATRGFGLILSGDGSLALALARRTELQVHLVEPDAAKMAAARKALSGAGVYGPRVVVTQGGLKSLPLADYFANLIVCPLRRPDDKTRSAPTPAWGVPTPAAEVLRMLKPCGGVAYVGVPPGPGPVQSGTLAAWLAGLTAEVKALGEADTVRVGTLQSGRATVTRGPLAGAGQWTHQYGEPGNTACGDDRRVRGSLGVLWYGDPGPTRMPSRHAGNVSPLAFGGRMFVQAERVIMAYDAYNGVKLWERDIPGALRLGMRSGVSNFAADGESLFVAVGDQCHRLDAVTGKTTRTYRLPPAEQQGPRRWGYLACADGVLFGSVAPPALDKRGNERLAGINAADAIFAVDIGTGKLKWTYEGDMKLMSVCVGGGRVYLVDRDISDAQRAAAMKGVDHKPQIDRRGNKMPADCRVVVALDADTGRRLWQRPQYLSDCVEGGGYAAELTVMYADDVLLLCGQPWNGHFWKQFNAGKFNRRSLIALNAADGRLKWSGHKGYRSRPLIVDGRVIAEPWGCDLQTGEDLTRTHPLTGRTSKWQMSRPGHHCGNIAAAPSALFFRSGVAAYYDLEGDYGTAHFGAQRPGCWINCIPANGLVMMPEASSGCVCAFSIMCTTVFQPRKTNRVWGKFSAAGPAMPIRQLSINFGAPGDRRAADGTLWLAYPRPGWSGEKSRLVFHFAEETKASFETGGRFREGNADFLKIASTRQPWIYASRAEGLRNFSLPLADKPGTYTVRLLFAETTGVKPGRRVFDVRLQDKTVLRRFDVAAGAGGEKRAIVKEFKGVAVTDVLTVSLKAVTGRSLLCGLEVRAED